MLLACLLLACQKEDGITPGTGFENLYTIQDDPNDSIQHKRKELYTTYGVPVLFNDTIGKVFEKSDVMNPWICTGHSAGQTADRAPLM